MPQSGATDPVELGVTDPEAPLPQDVPYPGTLDIHVDASDTRQGIFRVREKIPVQAGPLTLLYPKWIPAHHSPNGPIDKLAGLTVTAHGEPLAWRRYKYDVYAFRVDIPKGVSEIEVAFQYLSPRGRGEGAVEMTDAILVLDFDKTALYPAGHWTRRITCVPRVTFPASWQFGTALEEASRAGDTVTFKPVPFDVLVDAPIYAGKHHRLLDLDPGAKVPVRMHLFADAPKYLEAKPEHVDAHRNLVQQAYRLFGARHYDHYDFLVSLSDQLAHKGVEHHQSSEDSTRADYFTDWKNNTSGRDLFAHEFEHSWNGKFRRPADLRTRNFNVPMGDSLLWVYEGQTQFWGYVLTARAGLWTPEQYREALALIVARYDRNRPGFGWRGILDTTNDPTIARRASLPYRNWQMSEEYYNAGMLLWLAVDSKLRGLTGNARSIDDFARAFFGMDDGSWETSTYTLDDVVATLDGVAAFDWRPYLLQRVHAHEPPLEGIAAAGWKLAYTDQENEVEKQLAKRTHTREAFMLALGLAVGKEGVVRDVRWDGLAFKAGVGSGETVVAVNQQAYKPEVLEDALRDAHANGAPIELLLRYQDRFRTVRVDYRDGLQYPHLVRVDGTPDHLSELIAAKPAP